jgi:nucleoside-diphosphate-sugar epimerase
MKLLDRNDRVLITGATGFIGGRLVELLGGRGIRMRVVTSDFRNCARVARFPVDIVKADLSDHVALGRAVAGCDVVFHAAYQFGGNAKRHKVNLDGARSLAEAFLKHGGRRFVHVSSVAAYGDPRDGELTEETPPKPTTEPYSDTKLKIDRTLLELHRTRGLPVTILQPTIVYGPYGSTWTTNFLEQVRSMRIVLPAGGLCNAVYVDDVVSALILSAECDAAVGEAFLISGSSPTTWRQFYGAYEKIVDKEAIIKFDDERVSFEERRRRKSQSLTYQLYRAMAKRPELRQRLLNLPPHGWLLKGVGQFLPRAAKAVLKRSYESLWELPSDASEDTSHAERPLFLPDKWLRTLYASKTHVRIEKARKKLGYNPEFDLDEGMARTAEWARWANLLSN